MINEKYIGTLDNADKRWYNYVIHWQGEETKALDFLLKHLDCTRIYKDGSRPVMTNHYCYRTDIAGFMYILNNIKEFNPKLAEEYLNKLVNLHEKNLSFEKDTHPINYSKKPRVSRGNGDRKITVTNMYTGEQDTVIERGEKVVKAKENTSSRKARILSDKSISFAFNNFKISK